LRRLFLKPKLAQLAPYLLDPSGIALYENGLDFIDVDTGTPAKQTSIIYEYSFGGKSSITVEPESERYFVKCLSITCTNPRPLLSP